MKAKWPWFIAVGCVAAAVHFGVVRLLVEAAGLRPLAANPLGWLAAVGVSFSGHQRLTFREQNAPPLRAALRFLVVSAAGFAVNELAYAVLLHWGGVGYELALAAVLVGVALATYLLGRHWAFLGNRP